MAPFLTRHSWFWLRPHFAAGAIRLTQRLQRVQNQYLTAKLSYNSQRELIEAQKITRELRQCTVLNIWRIFCDEYLRTADGSVAP